MKKIFLLLGFVSLIFLQNLYAQYNNLWIPDTLSGTTFNLNIKEQKQVEVLMGLDT